jgi:hypothetical protein
VSRARAAQLCLFALFSLSACGDSDPANPEPAAGGGADKPMHAAGSAAVSGRGGADAARAGSGGAGGKPSKPKPASGGAGGQASERTPDAGSGDDGGERDSGQPSSEASPEILTQRYDNARTGANLREHTLSPSNVKDLSLLGSWSVDGELYAQVLVASDVELDDGPHAVAIVATMNDSVYAFDADAAPADAFLWQQGREDQLGSAGFCARNVGGVNGILSTPVIDKPRAHVYVVARDCDPNFPPEMPVCKQRLFQLDLRTGKVLHALEITGEVAAADGGKAKPVHFDPSAHWNRPALLLANDQLVIALGSGPAGQQHEEDFVFHGWVFRYDVSHLDAPPQVYCTTPRGRGGSVWQAGAGPAADEHAIYVTGANGIQADSKTHPPGEWPDVPTDQEDSVVRLELSADFPTPGGQVQQFWDQRPYISAGSVFQHMESGDNGFGSSGPMLIPDTTLLMVGTKAGLVYLLERDTLQSVQEPLSPFTDQPLQPGHSLYLHSWWGIPMTTQAFVFFRPEGTPHYGYAYAWAQDDRLRQLRFDYDARNLQLTASGDVPDVLGGGNLVLSAAGHDPQSAVLWATTRSDTGTSGPGGTVWAFDPLTLRVLWKTSTPAWSKFNPPTVVRGRVFVPSSSPDPSTMPQVLVYGLAQ